MDVSVFFVSRISAASLCASLSENCGSMTIMSRSPMTIVELTSYPTCPRPVCTFSVNFDCISAATVHSSTTAIDTEMDLVTTFDMRISLSNVSGSPHVGIYDLRRSRLKAAKSSQKPRHKPDRGVLGTWHGGTLW